MRKSVEFRRIVDDPENFVEIMYEKGEKQLIKEECSAELQRA